MLVLTRKVGQQVVFPGCRVTIDVLNVSKNRVRLGIVAPSTTEVHRSEIWQRIHSEGRTTPKPSSQ
jgi:carbon storage regulator CsrA